ncbi:MAG: pyridoxamine 5'-phosphate oxidase family protein [Hydrogenophaga sp.]|uniref:HugZ family pyridoxamine 5'-phosphate oxidase n=1 Tax=Hydrogenophaga sp. TaxID=1904254 RepID=UPI001D9A5BE3|nr:pyridoxamine 5'-phosphate oxidase family protein [Hydrogenophaga sp.]MBX3610475.1 pyridoxamine 5'-phosphate oxidase family protein [Hydrogenophaga sp.]
MTHEPRLTTLLRDMLHTRRTAALATVDEHGAPAVSMVPFAVDETQRCIVLHLSALAPHTAQLQRQPRAALLVAQGEVPGEPVHALPRVSIQVLAFTPAPEAPDAASARVAYLERFPEAAPMTELSDFRFVLLEPVAARQIAGFGAARTVDEDELRLALGPAP